jgi:hypothetical protein
MSVRPPGADRYLAELASSLTGPRRARARLLEELAGHLDDAIAAKVGLGLEPDEAEAEALAQIGDARTIADQWRARTDRARRRERTRLALAAALAAVAASVLGITSAASGHQNPTPPTSRARPAAPPLRERPWIHPPGFGRAPGWSEGRRGDGPSTGPARHPSLSPDEALAASIPGPRGT